MKTIKVSSQTHAKDLAGSVSSIMKRNKKMAIESIGAGAVNQSVKAIAIARGYLAPNGIEITVVPSFSSFEVDDKEEEMTGLSLKIEKKLN